MRKKINNIKPSAALLLMISALILLTSCGKKTSVTPYKIDHAVGIIIVCGQDQPQGEKVYANFSDHEYTYDLDAAVVYYFDYDSETAYAGGQNVTSLTFGADIDSRSVGAAATVGFIDNDDSSNTVTAYYLYFDENGVYFDSGKPFTSTHLGEGVVIEGSDYLAKVTLTAGTPVEYFTITCRQGDTELKSDTFDPQKFEDYYKYPLPAGTDNVEIVSYDASNAVIGQESFRNGERNSFVVEYDVGGLIMGAKTLYLMWNG